MDSNTALQELCQTEKAFGDFTAKRHWRPMILNESMLVRPLGFFLKV